MEATRVPDNAMPLPQNSYAEQVVLAGCMRDAKALARVRYFVHEEDFGRPENQMIWRAIEEAAAHGPVNPETVAAVLRKWGRLEEVGGLMDLLAEIPTDVLPFAGVVVDTSLRRRLVLLARDLEAAAYAPVSSADEVLAEHLRRVTEIVQDRLLRAIS